MWLARLATQIPQRANRTEALLMKTALTRLTTAGVIALVLLASACIGPLPTDPSGSKTPTPTVPGDPPDETVKG